MEFMAVPFFTAIVGKIWSSAKNSWIYRAFSIINRFGRRIRNLSGFQSIKSWPGTSLDLLAPRGQTFIASSYPVSYGVQLSERWRRRLPAKNQNAFIQYYSWHLHYHFKAISTVLTSSFDFYWYSSKTFGIINSFHFPLKHHYSTDFGSIYKYCRILYYFRFADYSLNCRRWNHTERL